MWRNAEMALIRGIHNAKPNFMPNGSSSCKKRKSTAWRKLIMADDSRETVAGVNVKSDMSDGQSEIDALESKKDIQSVSNVEFENANISQKAPFDWVLVATELRSCHMYAEVVGVVRRYILPQIDLSQKYCQTVRDVICRIAMLFYPKDHPPNVVPNKTHGDGNCFFWVVLHALFRTEERHIEVRVWIVFEAVLNEDLHLSCNYLSLGV